MADDELSKKDGSRLDPRLRDSDKSFSDSYGHIYICRYTSHLNVPGIREVQSHDSFPDHDVGRARSKRHVKLHSRGRFPIMM